MNVSARCLGEVSQLNAMVVHVVGTRPNFVKAAPVWSALRTAGVPQAVVHTGQHYDERLSQVFFRELELPEPDVNLGVGSGSQAEQTAALLLALERELTSRRPALLMAYGDVNSTLAAALVAAKLEIPLAHVEAGLRSFDRSMPEEINRLLTDQLADLLFVTSPEATGHLAREGIDIERIHFVGNPMIDTLLANLHRFDPEAARAGYGLPARYAVVTLHRPANVDDPEAAARCVRVLHEAAECLDLIIPLHPRGRAALLRAGLRHDGSIRVIEPVGYIEFMSLIRGAAAVITDSGGVQEETTMLGVPCLTLRPNTERPITISHGTNRLVSASDAIPILRKVLNGDSPAAEPPPLWDGRAGMRIAVIVGQWLERHG